jgi:hypothetical protein
MTIAEIGSIANVRGMRTAVPALGPNPGNTPTSIPTVTPIKQYIKFCQVRAVSNPDNKKLKESINLPPYHPNALTGNGTPKNVLKTRNMITVVTTEVPTAVYHFISPMNKINKTSVPATVKPAYGDTRINKTMDPRILRILFRSLPFGNTSEKLIFSLKALTINSIERMTSRPLNQIGNNPGPGPILL